VIPYRNPYVIEAVERASRRAAISVHGDLKRGLNSLATIASTATLLGLLGTVVLISTHTFYSCGGNWSSCSAPIGGRLSNAMALTALGLFVAILSFWFYRYLNNRMAAFDVEMENASVDLVNRLVVHLERLGPPATNVHWARPPKRSIDYPLKGPRLSIGRIYRHGMLQLIWPRLESELDADSVLHGGMWVLFAYALLGWLTYYFEGRSTAGILVLLFFAAAGLGLRVGSLAAILSVFSFFVFACIACVVPFGWTDSPTYLAVAPLLLIGSLKAARFLATTRTSAIVVTDAGWQVGAKNLWARLQPLPNILFGLLGASASLTVLFGTVLGIYSMGSDSSMGPNLHPGDWIISVNEPLMGTVHRGDLVSFPYWDTVVTRRVVGLPGDRIQVESGRLVLNGKDVTEPYRKQSYRGGLGDFPLPSEAFPNDFLRWEHQNAYGDRLKEGTAFVVPGDTYFLLNDDRNEVWDSRIFGPIRNSYIAGRPLLAYSAQKNPWSFPRFF
jgi:signal peptidase I